MYVLMMIFSPYLFHFVINVLNILLFIFFFLAEHRALSGALSLSFVSIPEFDYSVVD